MSIMWYNYRTGTYLAGDPTDDTINDYLPQEPAALSLYRLYRLGKLSVYDAMENVLMIYIGQQAPHEPTWSVFNDE